MNVLRKIERPDSFANKVYERVKEGIIYRQLKPGDVLNEWELAAALNVSRTPVREALKILENEGWICSKGKQKTVIPMGRNDAEEIYVLRLHNETLALKLAYPKLTQEHLNVLQQIVVDMEQCGQDHRELRRFLQLDRDFHLLFAQISGNQRLYDLMFKLTEQFMRFGFITFLNKERPRTAHSEHLEILKALQARNYDQAHQALAEHLSNSRQQVEMYMNWEEL